MSVALLVTTLDDASAAEALAARLVDERLAACVQIVPVRSVYRWEGARQSAEEYRLEMKIVAERWREVESAIRAHHPYALPEIVCLPITVGYAPYLDWVEKSAKGEV